MGATSRDRRIKQLIDMLDLGDRFVEDDGGADLPCPTEECPAHIHVNPRDNRARCDHCGLDQTAEQLLQGLVEARRSPAAQTERAVRGADAADAGNVYVFPGGEDTVRAAPLSSVDAQQEPPPAEMPGEPAPGRGVGETLIIALLSLCFLAAGLLAAAMSGFANYQAFGAMVDDPLQSRIWAWTGIIASVCSFGGFTFVYWHGAGGRIKEALRAGVFALAGAATSLVGTQMYMANTEQARLAEAEAAAARLPILEAQIADWQRELNGIPAHVRSVEGLEAYIAEVERVGRTHQKPYRDALDELGQARRRTELSRRIETARIEMARLAPHATAAERVARPPALSWFFAAMLEVFSSQGTSIGFVALMILAGRRPRGP